MQGGKDRLVGTGPSCHHSRSAWVWAFHLLAKDRDDVPQLHDVRRFRHEWERAASVDLRHGRPDAADTYLEHGRSRKKCVDPESMS